MCLFSVKEEIVGAVGTERVSRYHEEPIWQNNGRPCVDLEPTLFQTGPTSFSHWNNTCMASICAKINPSWTHRLVGPPTLAFWNNNSCDRVRIHHQTGGKKDCFETLFYFHNSITIITSESDTTKWCANLARSPTGTSLSISISAFHIRH